MTFKNWASLNPPVSRLGSPAPRSPGSYADPLAVARVRADDYRASVNRDFTCDKCGNHASRLFPMGAQYICHSCRDNPR